MVHWLCITLVLAIIFSMSVSSLCQYIVVAFLHSFLRHFCSSIDLKRSRTSSSSCLTSMTRNTSTMSVNTIWLVSSSARWRTLWPRDSSTREHLEKQVYHAGWGVAVCCPMYGLFLWPGIGSILYYGRVSVLPNYSVIVGGNTGNLHSSLFLE